LQVDLRKCIELHYPSGTVERIVHGVELVCMILTDEFETDIDVKRGKPQLLLLPLRALRRPVL